VGVATWANKRELNLVENLCMLILKGYLVDQAQYPSIQINKVRGLKKIERRYFV